MYLGSTGEEKIWYVAVMAEMMLCVQHTPLIFLPSLQIDCISQLSLQLGWPFDCVLTSGIQLEWLFGTSGPALKKLFVIL